MSKHLPLFKKYLPKTSKEIIGQDTDKIKSYIESYKTQKKKALLLTGPTGTGKTASVHAIAHELNLEIVEVNASDFRNEEGINLTIGNSIGQQSLFSKGKIILIDEIDGISGTNDRGGLNAVLKLIEKSSFPIVITANSLNDYKWNALKKECVKAEFLPLTSANIYAVLKKIADAEKIKIAEEVLKGISRMAAGDARAAVNDLQTLAGFAEELRDLDVLGERNRQETIQNALLKVLKSTSADVAKGAFDNIDEDIDECLLWLDENLPKEYTKPQDLARAYDMISRADVFKGRIRRWQHWRFLVYINELLTAGIAVSKDEKYTTPPAYKPTTKLLKIWMANQRFAKRKAIAQKIAQKTHTSVKSVIKDTIPYLKPIFKANRREGEKIADYLKLEKEELEWLQEK